jgi:hypothetical protein
MPTSESRVAAVDPAGLRRRLPREWRERLPPEDQLARWLDELGADLGELLAVLEPADLEGVVDGVLELRDFANAELASAAFERADERISERARRKIVRRAIHVLRSRGIDARTGAPARGSVLKPLGERDEQAFLTPIDPAGQRVAFLITPGTVVRVFEVLVSDEAGILRVEHLETKRRDARRLVERLGRGPLPISPVDPAELRSLLRRAVQRAGSRAPGNVDPAALAALTSGDPAPTPGERARERWSGRAKSDAEADSVLASRLQRGVVPPWLLSTEALDRLVHALASAERSPLVLSEAQQRARREELLVGAADELMTSELRELWAERLEETAAVLAAQADEEGAAALVQVAGRVRAPGPALAVPLLRSLLEYSLEFARQRASPQESGKLIVPG